MQYKLYDNANNDTSNVVKEVLKNRGIDDYKTYLNLDDSVLIPYNKLDNINDAVEKFIQHFNQEDRISILVDSDPDGYCSAAMMYLYIKKLNSDYPVSYILHSKAKMHGLSEDVIIPDDTKLLIIPDAGTNDVMQCKELSSKNINIIILDHHEKEKDNPYAVIVNNQISKDYLNKNLSGAGIVYKFLQALDDENWTEYADDYLDLCALANISDVMDMRSFETRYLVELGLCNIHNKCFQALIDSQDYSMNGKVTIHNVQWYITTILNGCIRFGTNGDKELLFKAFIGSDETFEYKKRATKDKPAELIQETIYERAARLCKNAKSRQDKQKEKCVFELVETVKKLPDEDKVIVLDTSNVVDKSITGLVAIKIADLFNKPCILLSKYYDSTKDKYVYGGSARNVKNSPIDSLKDIVNSTKYINGVGHANAFGIVGLDIDKKNESVKELNELLKDVVYDSTYKVDFILDVNEVDVKLVTEFSQFDDIIGQGIDEPLIAIENIELTREQFEIFGKNEDTVSFNLNDIKYIQFKCKEGNPLYDWLQDAWSGENIISMNIVGKPTINEFNGIRIPQIIIEDVNVIKTENENDFENNDNNDNDLDWW